jgi:hypothetical protein
MCERRQSVEPVGRYYRGRSGRTGGGTGDACARRAIDRVRRRDALRPQGHDRGGEVSVSQPQASGSAPFAPNCNRLPNVVGVTVPTSGAQFQTGNAQAGAVLVVRQGSTKQDGHGAGVGRIVRRGRRRGRGVRVRPGERRLVPRLRRQDGAAPLGSSPRLGRSVAAIRWPPKRRGRSSTRRRPPAAASTPRRRRAPRPTRALRVARVRERSSAPRVARR